MEQYNANSCTSFNGDNKGSYTYEPKLQLRRNQVFHIISTNKNLKFFMELVILLEKNSIFDKHKKSK